MDIREIEAKSIIVKSKLPDTDYVVNPYTGCQFACMYCYASFMGKFNDQSIENWGNYVYVKRNAVDVFKKEIKRLQKGSPSPTILLSSVTDPYQVLEKKYEITRGILGELVENNYNGRVCILTKSPLVTRDIDLISRLSNAQVGLTITETDDKISRFLEVSAPLASSRIKTLATLNSAGIETYAFVGPLLPHLSHSPELLDKLFCAISNAGTRSVYIEHINLKKYIYDRLANYVDKSENDLLKMLSSAKSMEYRASLELLINPLIEKYNFSLRLGEVINHA